MLYSSDSGLSDCCLIVCFTPYWLYFSHLTADYVLHTRKPGLAWPQWPVLASKLASPQFLSKSWPQKNFGLASKIWSGLKFGLLNNVLAQFFFVQAGIFLLNSDWFYWMILFDFHFNVNLSYLYCMFLKNEHDCNLRSNNLIDFYYVSLLKINQCIQFSFLV